MGLSADLRQIKNEKEFVKKREKFDHDLEHGRRNYGKRYLALCLQVIYNLLSLFYSLLLFMEKD